MARAEVFAPDEIAVLHVISRVVRRCFLMGNDPLTGKNFDHRKLWIERELERLASCFGIDLLTFSVLSNHFHLVLRSRPDVVKEWSDREVARRWRLLCPVRKGADGSALEPNQAELNSITGDAEKLAEMRSRLSDVSWWMRLLCQRIAQRANREDDSRGKFWESRYRAVRLLDESAILACSAYVDLNPIRAALAETIESSDHTSAQMRCQAMQQEQVGRSEAPAEQLSEKQLPDDKVSDEQRSDRELPASDHSDSSLPRHDRTKVLAADGFLAPVMIDESSPGALAHTQGRRCSDKGFLDMSSAEYLQLLDWTARQVVKGKQGSTPANFPPVPERLKIQRQQWESLVTQFGELYSLVAGQVHRVEQYRSRVRRQRHYLKRATRELLST